MQNKSTIPLIFFLLLLQGCVNKEFNLTNEQNISIDTLNFCSVIDGPQYPNAALNLRDEVAAIKQTNGSTKINFEYGYRDENQTGVIKTWGIIHFTIQDFSGIENANEKAKEAIPKSRPSNLAYPPTITKLGMDRNTPNRTIENKSCQINGVDGWCYSEIGKWQTDYEKGNYFVSSFVWANQGKMYEVAFSSKFPVMPFPYDRFGNMFFTAIFGPSIEWLSNCSFYNELVPASQEICSLPDCDYYHVDHQMYLVGTGLHSTCFSGKKEVAVGSYKLKIVAIDILQFESNALAEKRVNESLKGGFSTSLNVNGGYTNYGPSYEIRGGGYQGWGAFELVWVANKTAKYVTFAIIGDEIHNFNPKRFENAVKELMPPGFFTCQPFFY